MRDNKSIQLHFLGKILKVSCSQQTQKAADFNSVSDSLPPKPKLQVAYTSGVIPNSHNYGTGNVIAFLLFCTLHFIPITILMN